LYGLCAALAGHRRVIGHRSNVPGYTPCGEENNQNDRKDHSDYYSPPDFTIFIEHIDLLFLKFLKHIFLLKLLKYSFYTEKSGKQNKPDNRPKDNGGIIPNLKQKSNIIRYPEGYCWQKMVLTFLMSVGFRL
jgi:hypothetical protein